MQALFQTDAELLSFIFRITDNGGESADRFTIMTNDGDYITSSGAPTHPQGVFLHGEGFDPQIPADHVEAGTERDLRWIDLPEVVRRTVMRSLNDGYADFIASFTPPENRADAQDYATGVDLTQRIGEGVYGVPGAYRVRRETYPDDGSGADDSEPMATLREALLYTLPDAHDVAGEEYHGTVDLADTEGGPTPLWDRDEEPPVIDPEYSLAAVEVRETSDPAAEPVWFATMVDAQNWIRIRRDNSDDDLDFHIEGEG